MLRCSPIKIFVPVNIIYGKVYFLSFALNLSYANKLGQEVQKVTGKFLKAFTIFKNIISLESHTRKYFELAIA